MRLGALGSDRYRGNVDVVTPYLENSGAGQPNAAFPLH